MKKVSLLIVGTIAIVAIGYSSGAWFAAKANKVEAASMDDPTSLIGLDRDAFKAICKRSRGVFLENDVDFHLKCVRGGGDEDADYTGANPGFGTIKAAIYATPDNEYISEKVVRLREQLGTAYRTSHGPILGEICSMHAWEFPQDRTQSITVVQCESTSMWGVAKDNLK